MWDGWGEGKWRQLYLNNNFKNLIKSKIYLFLDRGKGRERRRETSMSGYLSHAPNWGSGPQPRHVCILTGNQTSNSLVHRPALNPLSHTSQDLPFLIDNMYQVVHLFCNFGKQDFDYIYYFAILIVINFCFYLYYFILCDFFGLLCCFACLLSSHFNSFIFILSFLLIVFR